jgi:hypothetical protein
MTSLASQKLKFQLVFCCLVVVAALVITWLMLGDSSPFHDYFLWHSALPDAWQVTTIIPFLLSAVISGNPHSPPMVIFIFLLIIQWTILGYFLSIPMAKFWVRHQKPEYPSFNDR